MYTRPDVIVCRYIAILRAMTAVTLIFAACARSPEHGADWPAAFGDESRSRVTADTVGFPLEEIWRLDGIPEPRPAWPASAAQDYWHDVHTITPEMDFDCANHLVIANGTVFFGSSADDRIRAVDTDTGRERWSFITEGPVRFAPAFFGGKVYAGSDDGCVYCLDAGNGSLVWKTDLSDGEKRLPGNERIISLLPVRSGVIAGADTVWCAAGLFPGYGAYLCALDSRTGAVFIKNPLGISPQGYIAASSHRLIVPGGRAQPGIYSRSAGDYLGALKSPGGSYVLVYGDNMVNGPGRRSGQIDMSAENDTESVLRFNGLRMVIDRGMVYILSEDRLTAVDRLALSNVPPDSTEKRAECRLWEQECENPCELILAGDTLIVGGEGTVKAFAASDGTPLGGIDVNGGARSLAVAGGRLYVSTDSGAVYCFGDKEGDASRIETAPSARESVAKRSDVHTRSAERIIRESGISKGYCFDLECLDGRLACELARISDLNIVCVAYDDKTAGQIRKTVDAAGLYGRISVHVASADNLPYIHYVANLVVSEKALVTGDLPPSASEVSRILRPSGGTACFVRDNGKALKGIAPWMDIIGPVAWESGGSARDMLIGRRDGLADVGKWVQLYADAANTSCSGDALREPLALQWFGRPGPRHMIDRHHRAMSPLYDDCRLFIPANDRIYALDPFNGTLLWKRDIAGTRKVGALKDCGNMVLSGNDLLVAHGDSCIVLDTETGETDGGFHAVALPDSTQAEWGYLSVTGNLLLGSSQKSGASFRDLDYRNMPNNGSLLFEEDFRDVVASVQLFALDRFTGEKEWVFNGGSIMNNTVAVGGDRLYFIGTTNSGIAEGNGRVRIDRFCENGLYMAALDPLTGDVMWERPCSFPFQHIIFLSYSDETVLVTGTYNEGGSLYYGLYAYDAANGDEKWITRFLGMSIRGNEPAPLNGSHGEQWQHPVIVNGTIYLRPYAFDLLTGEKKDYTAYRGGHGCGGLTGSQNYLFGRGSTPRMYPIDTTQTEGIQLTTVSRPGCWLNMIPAGGLVMIPESSSGCTCSYAIQTSMAFSMAE